MRSVLLAAARRCRICKRFARNEDGLALIEFAFVLPLMVLLYVGSVAVTMGVTTDRKLTLLARSLGDIVSQGTNMTPTSMTQVFDAGRVVMSPYNASATVLKMRLSSVRIKTNGQACIDWTSSGTSGYSRTAGSNVTSLIPIDLRIPDTYLIVPEVEYIYNPVIGTDITGGPLTLHDVLFFRPRQGTSVTFNSAPLNPTCAG